VKVTSFKFDEKSNQLIDKMKENLLLNSFYISIQYGLVTYIPRPYNDIYTPSKTIPSKDSQLSNGGCPGFAGSQYSD
jgi:hypothetical protein